MKRSLFTWMGIGALLLGSCADGKVDPVQPDPPTAANTLRLSIGIQGAESQQVLTRTPVDSEPGEDNVNSLYLLFFESKADNTGTFVDYVEIPAPLGVDPIEHDIDMVGTQLDVTAAYHILAVANIGLSGTIQSEYLNGMTVARWMQQWSGKNETQVMDEARFWSQIGEASLGAVPSDGLLMSGRTEKAAHQFEVKLALTRVQARFDVVNELKSEYRVSEVYIYNAYPSASVWNSGTVDYSTNTGRHAFYCLYQSSGNQDVVGKLYAFENQVPMPVRNDNMTTCLIIGLIKTGESTPTYYRVNIAPDEGAQRLMRNNVYRVTINNVDAPGEATVAGAYAKPGDSGLDYMINFWNSGGSMVIVQDGNNFLGLPTQTIELGAEASTTSYSIFTFSSSSQAPQLTYTSDITPSAGVSVSLAANNRLTLTVPALAPGAERQGKITFTYGSLQATMNVHQSAVVEDYLRVYLPDGGIPPFAPFAGIPLTGDIRVEASDTWTATLFLDGFSFGASGTTRVTEIGTDISNDPTRDDLINADRFSLRTFSANNDTQVREAFIVISLDKDSENHTQLVRLSQQGKAAVSLIPNQASVTFSSTGPLASIPNNTIDTFTVRPSTVDLGGGEQFADWGYVFEGSAGSMFTATMVKTTDINQPEGNTITIRPVGANLSGSPYTATLKVRLTSDPTSFATLNVIQLSSGATLSPNTVPDVAKTGGTTQYISVSADNPALTWKAVLTLNNGDGRLVNHNVQLLRASDGTAVDPNVAYPLSERFRVVFPKIYFPNRELPVSAKVTVTLYDGATATPMSNSITVNQTPLTSVGFFPFAQQTAGYGNLGTGSYNTDFRNAIQSMGAISTKMTVNTNFYHSNNYLLTATYNWANAQKFRLEQDGMVFISAVYIETARLAALNNSSSPIYGWGIQSFTGTMAATVNSNSAVQNSKIYQLIMGRTGYGTSITGANWVYPQIHATTTRSVSWPSTAVPLIVQSSDPTIAFMVIDPVSNVIYMGEDQLLHQTKGEQTTLLNNLMIYIRNASMYGSHFTELMVGAIGTGEPAPWDSYWGANVGFDDRR